MKIATFNTNSIRARIDILKAWLAEEKPDILAVQETKVQDEAFPAEVFKEMGYRVIFRGQKSYNGVALFSLLPPEDIRTNLYEQGDEQARFISASINGIKIINIYVPQGFSVESDKFTYKIKWLRDLLSFIRACCTPRESLILLGDFNIACDSRDLYDPEGFQGKVGFHFEEQAVLKEYFEWGFVDIFRKHEDKGGFYTFWDYRIPNGFKRNMGWRIDYIMATPPLAEKSMTCRIDPEPRQKEKPSDHTFLVAEFAV
jgi:exodeoxyribonuclease-3